jgi:hypothetical protein
MERAFGGKLVTTDALTIRSPSRVIFPARCRSGLWDVDPASFERPS